MGHIKITQLLIDSGAWQLGVNQEILLVAEAKGHADIVKLLIQEGAAKNTDRWMGLKAKSAKMEEQEEDARRSREEAMAAGCKKRSGGHSGRSHGQPSTRSTAEKASRAVTKFMDKASARVSEAARLSMSPTRIDSGSAIEMSAVDNNIYDPDSDEILNASTLYGHSLDSNNQGLASLSAGVDDVDEDGEDELGKSNVLPLIE
jgi:hypothetical protein